MNYSDEELQHKIENKNAMDDSADAKAYQKVFSALEKEPYSLPLNFADDVVKRLESRSASVTTDYVWLALGLLTFIVATVITVVTTGFAIDFSVFRFVSGYYGLFAFGLAFILLIQYLDQRLVFRKMDL
jgi:hypothetical protein